MAHIVILGAGGIPRRSRCGRPSSPAPSPPTSSKGTIHPYVGVGLNYTRHTSVKLNAAPMLSPVRQVTRGFP